jgi:hypothetical protein
MSWNEWELVWKRQSLPTGASTNVDEIKESFEKEHRKTHFAIWLRNIAEGGTGLLLTPVIVYLWSSRGSEAWPVGISAVFFFGVTCVFVVDQVRIWKTRLGPETPLLAKVEAEIKELRHQRRLIQTWIWWYLLPLVLGIVIGLYGLSRANFGEAPSGMLEAIFTTPATRNWIIILSLTVSIALWRVVAANRETVEKRINPRLQQLETLRGSMLSSDGTEPGSFG